MAQSRLSAKAVEESDDEDEYIPPLMEEYFTKEMAEQYEPLKSSMEKVLASDGKDDEEWKNFQTHFNAFKNFECFSNWDGKKYDIIFYGVSGYTGYLMMQYLKRISLKKTPEKFTFAFAGRTLWKVKEMRDREFEGTEWADTPCLSASFDNIHSMIDLARSAHVIVNVAGPYMATQGEILIDSCIHMGTHYCDISGEIPWSRRTLELHNYAKEKGVFIVPSSASAGGFPDLGTYLLAKKARSEYGEELRKCICYCTGGGATATASGGTLKTRDTMSKAGDEVRAMMGDPFSLGGFIPQTDRNGMKQVNIEFGTGKATPKFRGEDMDANMSKISEDKKFGIWRGPHVYSYFDTRVVRRSNALLADFANEPYGRNLNFLEYAWLPAEVLAAMQAAGAAAKEGGGEKEEKKSTGVEAEKERLMAQGTYYAEGEGPPLETLDDAWTGYFMWAETEGGNEVKMSMIGRDGYFETARAAIEMAMCLRFDYDKLSFKGGVLTPTVAGTTNWASRLIDSGLVLRMNEWVSEAERVPPPY